MQVKLIAGHDAGAHPDLIDQMFRLRARVFKERLDWNVAVANGRERDMFDDLHPLYVLAIDEFGRVAATFRLLRTMGPHMLADAFQELLPVGHQVSQQADLGKHTFCRRHPIGAEA